MDDVVVIKAGQEFAPVLGTQAMGRRLATV
jgi:hypothetical protein